MSAQRSVLASVRDQEFYRLLNIVGELRRRLRVIPPADRELAAHVAVAAAELQKYGALWRDAANRVDELEERAAMVVRETPANFAPVLLERASSSDPCHCEHSRGDHARNSGECLDDDCPCMTFHLDRGRRDGH